LTIDVLATQFLANGESASTWYLYCPDTIITNLLFNTTSGSIIYVDQTKDSVWVYDSAAYSVSRYSLMLPLMLGESWGSSGGFGYVRSIDSMAELNAPAGRFDGCFQVHSTGGWWQAPVYRMDWVKESVGLIKTDYFQGGLINYKFSLTLKAYSIQNPR
jgi:hypothetical protein